MVKEETNVTYEIINEISGTYAVEKPISMDLLKPNLRIGELSFRIISQDCVGLWGKEGIVHEVLSNVVNRCNRVETAIRSV